ncbi:MAG: DUF86 domain-containing protein [Patescibacteria group bacterium]|nr:DUF86 domain-containing protein [Patescibacteria group bacterium]
MEEIKDFGRKVVGYTQDLDFENFIVDEKLQLAVLKLIENIGEASKRLSQNARDKYSGVDWHKAMAMRDRLVHHYMDVDLSIVYDVAINEIPALLKNLE